MEYTLLNDPNKSDSFQKISTIKIEQINKDTLSFLIKSKEQKTDQAYLLGGLIERGFDEIDATEILNQIPSYVEKEIKKASEHKLMGTLLFISGLSVKFLPLSKESNLAIIILANVTMLLGILRYIHGFMNKKRFSKIEF